MGPDFQLAFEQTPTPFLMVLPNDPVFTILAANDAFVRVSGVRREGLVGRGVFEVFPDNPDDPGSVGPRSVRESFRRAIASGAPDQMPTYRYDVERIASAPRGFEERYWSARTTPVLRADGGVEYLLQSVEEITDKVLAEGRASAARGLLETSEKRFRQLAETTGFGLAIAEMGGAMTYLNPTAMQMIGYTEEEVKAGLVRWDRLTPPEFAERDAEAWREILVTGRCAPYEKEYIAKDGRRVPILIAASLLEQVGERTDVAVTLIDLTERNRSEQYAFLVRLDDAMRGSFDPDEVVRTAARMLAEHLDVDRCAYGSCDGDEETIEILAEYAGPGIPSMIGRYPLSGFGVETVRLLRANRPQVVENVDTDVSTADVRALYQGVGVRAHASVPLHKAGRLAAAMGVHQFKATRRWRAEEIELLRRVANRCWESIERSRLTRALQASEQRLRLSQRTGRIGSFEWFLKEDAITWTSELEELYGVTAGTFGGSAAAWSKLVVAEDAERVREGLERCTAEKKGEYSFEFRAKRADGTIHWLRGDVQIFYDGAGRAERMVGVNIDIDAQKQAEGHLRQQWHTFDTVLSNSPDALYTFDLEGRLTYANREFLSRLKMTLEEAIGKDGTGLGYPPEIVERIKGQIKSVARTGQPVRDYLSFQSPTDESRYYEYILVPVPAANGQVETVAGSTRDITEPRRAEEEERKRQEQLRESARLESLGIMAGGIAHDFNNLLTGILGNASMLVNDVADEQRPMASQIILAAERAADLTRQMLAYSGKGRFEVEALSLNQMIQENLMLLRASLSRSVSIELELSEEDYGVEADRAQIQQVVMNLLINASEAVGDRAGRVVIKTSLQERMTEEVGTFTRSAVGPGSYVVFEVRDNGSGMSAATLKRIFDPFFTTKFTGRGLGLAAVLGIVKGHKGNVEVESEVGLGTTFRVYLPALRQANVQGPVGKLAEPARATGQTVLVVDDEKVVRNIAIAALERNGFHVLAAANGSEAVDWVRAEPGIDLIVLDLTMPVMTGEQALPLIRAIRPEIAIILSSGYSEAEISRRFASAGITGVLSKPYTGAAIVAKVNEAMRLVC